MIRSPFWVAVLAFSLTDTPARSAAKPAAANPEFAVKVERGIVYGKGGDKELKLDLAMPKEGKGPWPALVCVHGGSWRTGSREQLSKAPIFDNRSLIEFAAAHGYVAASISYRLVKDGPFPAQIEDCKAAVRFLRAHADKYSIRADRIGAVGFSAGGHLVCLLGLVEPKDGLEGKGGYPDQSSRVQAVVSFFGPTDFTAKSWNDAIEDAIFVPLIGAKFKDDPEAYKKASPISYVRKTAPPFLFVHGTKDPIVDIGESRKLADKLKSVGASARLIAVEGAGHGWVGTKALESAEQTLKFLDEHLKK